ncbi:MAG: single-stranded DNA-binding protein [Candidatus Nanopelagicales bacterium]|jgi:single-strand DNA-binding protein|nr:single-stranded DNA-binding protein [Candidatus Nanopelagicales bacterium]MCU0298433.1 single-stranded DNA-binding protein [Candidatus Nanopelagicales bacterium]
MLTSMEQNSLTLIGTLASDVATTTTESGAKLARFRLAVRPRRWDRTRNTWIDGEPTFVAVTCWRRLAENVAASLRRGDPVIVTGRLRVKRDPEHRVTRVEVDAMSVGLDLNRVSVNPRAA